MCLSVVDTAALSSYDKSDFRTTHQGYKDKLEQLLSGTEYKPIITARLLIKVNKLHWYKNKTQAISCCTLYEVILTLDTVGWGHIPV